MYDGGIKLLNHSIYIIVSILLIQIVAQIQTNYDDTKRQICFPKNSSDKDWKLNVRFVVEENNFNENMLEENIQCFPFNMDLDDFHCFMMRKINDEFQADGAFMADHVLKIRQITIPTTMQSTETDTMPTASTTSPIPNPILCDEPKWINVKPAVLYNITEEGKKIIADKAIRVGFIDYNEKNGFLEIHVIETIVELIKNATLFFNESTEVSDWIKENGNWLPNVKYFQYVRLDEKLQDYKSIMMVLYNCSCGKFIFAPTTKYDNKIEMDKQIYDWSKDFEHIDGCVEKQEDISTSQLEPNQRRYLMKPVGGNLELNVKDFDIGLYNYGKFDNAKCEAFKYKYGYTFPLRSDNLNESANNWARIKRMGRLVSSIDMACKPLARFTLRAEFATFRRSYMVRLGLATIDCEEAKRQASDDCVACLVKSELFWERTCDPFVDCQIIQTIYECNNINDNKKFTIRIPRVDGHQNFKINGTEYASRDRVLVYRLYNMKRGSRTMKVLNSNDYNLYDNNDED